MPPIELTGTGINILIQSFQIYGPNIKNTQYLIYIAMLDLNT